MRLERLNKDIMKLNYGGEEMTQKIENENNEEETQKIKEENAPF